MEKLGAQRQGFPGAVPGIQSLRGTTKGVGLPALNYIQDEEAQLGTFLNCLHICSSLVAMESQQGQREKGARVTRLELKPVFPLNPSQVL